MRRAHRVGLEAAMAVAFIVATVVTAIWPTWLESLFGWAPDGGSGESEWGLVVVFGLAAVVAATVAVLDLRGARGRRRPTA